MSPRHAGDTQHIQFSVSQGAPTWESLRERAIPIATLVAALSLLVVLALFVRFVEQRLFEEHETRVLRDKERVLEPLNERMEHHKTFLRDLAAPGEEGAMAEAQIVRVVSQYLAARPELLMLCRVGTDGIASWTAPKAPSAPEAAPALQMLCPDLPGMLADAAASAQPLCTEAFAGERGRLRFLILTPIFQDGEPLGALVGACDFNELLRNAVSSDLLGRYRLTVLDKSGQIVAELSMQDSVDDRFAQEVSLASVVPGLAMRIVPYETGLGRYGAVLKHLAMVLGVCLSVGIWLLGRDIRMRMRAEGELRLSREELRRLAAHLQEAREEERIRMARDIHDELGRAMTAMKIGLAWLKKRAPNVVGHESVTISEKLESLSELVDTTLKWVRKTASDLRPQMLDDFGIVAALEWQADEFRKRMGIRCQTHLPATEIALDQARATALFRICQESLTNVARYAGATRVDLGLEAKEGLLLLTVSDNGKGITTDEIHNSRSLGLLGMRERAYSVGAEFDIYGTPGQGTTVTVRLPYTGKDEAIQSYEVSETRL